MIYIHSKIKCNKCTLFPSCWKPIKWSRNGTYACSLYYPTQATFVLSLSIPSHSACLTRWCGSMQVLSILDFSNVLTVPYCRDYMESQIPCNIYIFPTEDSRTKIAFPTLTLKLLLIISTHSSVGKHYSSMIHLPYHPHPALRSTFWRPLPGCALGDRLVCLIVAPALGGSRDLTYKCQMNRFEKKITMPICIQLSITWPVAF